MKNIKQKLEDIIEKNELISKLNQEILELENDFSGVTFNHDGQQITIEFIDVLENHVQLLIEEDNDEYVYSKILSIYELLEII